MKTIFHIISTLTIIGLISGGLLSVVGGWAEPLIIQNQKKETEKAIFLVQPQGKKYETIPNLGFEIYKVFDENYSQIGYSMAYDGNGFQGKIRIMLGLSKDLNSITAMEILDQVETPGLGTKVTEPDFKKQFESLQTMPLIKWIKNKEPENPNEVQAITGATISSKSVVEIINEGVAKAKISQQNGKL